MASLFYFVYKSFSIVDNSKALLLYRKKGFAYICRMGIWQNNQFKILVINQLLFKINKMRRNFTFLLTAVFLLMSGLSWGQTRTQINWTASEQGYANQEAITSVVFDDYVSAIFNKGTNNNAPKYFNSGAAIRCYGGNYFTITTTVGNLTEIAITFGSSDGSNAITTDVGTYQNGTWTGSSNSVTFTIGGTTGNRRIAGFSITYSSGGQQTVATPTFSPAAGTYYEAQNVTISCTTDGATIYYTTDGNDPTTSSAVYSTPIAISQTTTVKAMAVKSGMSNSSIASATYTIQAAPTVITIAAARALALNEYALVQGIVTFIDGTNIYVQDETAGIDLYLNSGTVPSGLALGDKVQAYGKRAVYKGLVELSGINGGSADQFSVISTGNTLPLVEKTIAEILTDHAGTQMLQSTRVKIVNATIGTINTSGNTPLTQGESTTNIYKVPTLDNISEGDNVDVIGVIGCYNAPQLRVAYASDVTIHETPMETVATPTFSPVAGTYTEAQNVTIACATEGASIYYTLDGTDPGMLATGMNGMLYENAIAISETTTVKAIAVKQGMNPSEIASALYTIETGPQLVTIAAARALALNEYALVQGIVTFIDGKNVYVQDETAGIDLFLNANAPATLAIGDKVQAYGKRAVFKGLVELSGINANEASQFSVISTGNTLPVAVKTIAEINADAAGTNMLQSTRVKIIDATVGTINTGGNTPITQETNSLNIYKMPVVEGLLEGDIATVIGVIGCYNTLQLRIATAADVTYSHPVIETVATPTFSPAAGEYATAQNVTIACATEGASIYYTLDGTDPTANSTAYTEAITISDTTTVKAIAMKEGMNNSEIASATYIITPTPTLTFNKLFTHTDVTDNGVYMIVDVAGGYALTSANGAGAAPAAVAVTIENNAITGQIDEALQWNIKAVEGGYTINPINSTETFLYTTNTNNGVRVGSNDNKVWELDITDTVAPNYHGFKNVAFNRYLGVFSNSNWRTYTSINNNIKNTQIEIFVLGEAPVHTFYAVNVAEGITNGTVTAAPTSAEAGTTITVTAQPASGYELATLTYTYGTTTNNINLETMQFVMPAGDVTVNATFTELPHVANPTFSPAAGSYITAKTVSIACATEGATIYYTIDGSDPTANSPVYAEPFTVNATTTVKAIAVKEGMNNSDVTSAEYTIIVPMTIAEARALANDVYALVQGVVTFIDGRNVYVQDATAGIVLYLNSNAPSTLAIGDMVLGYGKKAVYKGLVELSGINAGNDNQFMVLSSNNPLPLAVKTIAEINADAAGDNMLQSTRVQIVDATIGTINNSNNTPISQDENTLNIYKLPVVAGLEEGDFVTVTGVIGCYNTIQLRVNSADDVTYTHPAGIFVNPASLAGFNYVYEEGPSTVKTFTITGRSLTAPTHIVAPESFEISSFPGETFVPETQININTYTGAYSYSIKVRLKAGLEIGTYEESITIFQDDVDTLYVALSGNVTDQPQPNADYVRISDLSELTSGSKVVFAARYNENANEYFAMTAQASGKPTGVLFTSEVGTTEVLPSTITDEEATYYWTVDVNGANYTFTNANGDVLGYTSSTNFATGGDNTAWTITSQTSEEGAMVPNYTGFVVNNVNVAVRAIALNSNHNFGPYHTQNMGADNYNFFLDIFATAGSGTLACATPTFSPAGGTYYEEQEVTISCTTADATIYYTLDGTDPTANSAVYSEPIAVAENTTIKAIAMKEGYEDSGIAEAEYVIILDAATIFYQDWEGEMNGWTFVTVEGGNAWTIATYSNNHYAYANGYNGGVNEQWCISPAFDLNVYSNAMLSFRTAKNYNGPDLQLFFSNNYNGETPATATWTELEFNKSTGSYAWVESGVIDLAGFTGESCYIGFKYTSTETEAAAWEIDDITLMGFTSNPYLTATPTSLTGFTHMVGEGPSAAQTFVITGGNLPDDPNGLAGVTITCNNANFEMSTDGVNYYSYLGIWVVGTLDPTTIYVRLNGAEVGTYEGVITIEDNATATVSLSGTVTEQPVPGGDWIRILSLSDLHDGDQVILASRYDATVGDGYYAMTASVSGKPDGVLFTSVNEEGIEKLPAEISGDADTYLWSVIRTEDIITLVNAAGDSLGYSSSTNFSGNVNTEWNIVLETSGENAMVPNYTGFVITNGETTNRGIAKNASHKFGAYSTSNINNADYNFYLDLFVLGGTATQTVATPVFSMASGTYYEEIDVEITCATEGATIYYTTDGSDPTAESAVYAEPIHIDADMTLKAIAMMEGYENSGIATANYVVITDVIIIFNQDWEGEMNGWTFVTVEGNKPWTIGTYNGNKYANANGYNDDVDNEQWCISPAFNLNNYEGVKLSFMNATKFDGPALELFFSNDYDGQDPTAATWQPLEFTMSEGNYTWTESGEISLDGFSGAICYIAFKYTSTIADGAAAWEVDDIVLSASSFTSVNETEKMNVMVWNRTHEIVVDNHSGDDLVMVVYNLLGQPVMSNRIATGSNCVAHNLSDGLYLVTLRNAQGMMTVKIVVR